MGDHQSRIPAPGELDRFPARPPRTQGGPRNVALEPVPWVATVKLPADLVENRGEPLPRGSDAEHRADDQRLTCFGPGRIGWLFIVQVAHATWCPDTGVGFTGEIAGETTGCGALILIAAGT